MKILLKSAINTKLKNSQWIHGCENISYFPNGYEIVFL